MIMRISALLALVFCLQAPLSEARTPTDAVLEAMTGELERSKDELVLEDHGDRPRQVEALSQFRLGLELAREVFLPQRFFFFFGYCYGLHVLFLR